MSKYRHYQRTADQLRHLLEHDTAPDVLTDDETDWARLLMERLYQLANRTRPRG